MASKLEQEINKLDKEGLRAELKAVVPEAARINAENMGLVQANLKLHARVEELEAEIKELTDKPVIITN